MKDQEINRIAAALYEAQRNADEAHCRLEQAHGHAAIMQGVRRDRQEALAELADLEGHEDTF